MIRRAAAAWALAVCLSLPAAAASRRDELKKTEAAIEAAKAKQEEISGQAGRVEKELGEMRISLAATAQKLREAEREAGDAEEKLAILQSQLDEKTIAMRRRREQIGNMLAAALRLSRTPPEAAMMMPGDFAQTLRSVRAVDAIATALKTETESLSRQLAELEKLKRKVQAGQLAAQKKREALSTRQEALKQEIDERQRLFSKLAADRETSAKELDALAKKSSNLKDLIASIETSRDKPAKRSKTSATDSRLRSFAQAKGRIRLPVAGTLLRGYGVALNINETTRGLTLRTPAKASVLSPFDAEVVYAGTFLNYGKLVILRHSDDFHTLISGMARIDVSSGQFLLEGEPIGAMGDHDSGDRLYLELRQENQPIDPAPWIDLKKT